MKGSPPSATQTERAVFPHSAFMNGVGARCALTGNMRASMGGVSRRWATSLGASHGAPRPCNAENRLIGRTGKPDFDNPKVGVNSRLFDKFDLDAVPVTVVDGKNRW